MMSLDEIEKMVLETTPLEVYVTKRLGWDGGVLLSNKFGERASDYRTQKARGVNAIRRSTFRPLNHRFGLVGQFPKTLYTLPHDGMGLCDTLFAGTMPQAYFARPCPTVPRHGFVDSRVVLEPETLKQVVEETLKEDPNGEVLVMSLLDGDFSAVAHNAGIAWGHGNDGVTGFGAGWFIPCPTVPAKWIEFMVSQWDPGAKFYDVWEQDMEGATPYVELVEHKGSVVPVQVRAGPPQQTSHNYIPRLTEVTRILKPNLFGNGTTALLQWEKEVGYAIRDNGGKPDGLVLWSQGMSLASHWAIHAIQAGITVITDEMPVIGQVIEPTEDLVKPLTDADRKKLAKRIREAQLYPIGDFKQGDVILTAMAACHAMTFWGNEDHLIALRAIAIEMVARFVASACIGEARHFYASGPGRSSEECCPDHYNYEDGEDDPDYKEALKAWEESVPEKESHLPWEEIFGTSKRCPMSRSSVYQKMLSPTDVARRKTLLGLARDDFRTKGWSPDGDDDYACSYGGPKWAAVAEAGLALMDSTEAFLGDPSRKNWDALQVQLNYACHAAHNGGGVLTKWIKEDALNYIASIPTFGLMNYFAGFFTLNGFGVMPSDKDHK